MTATAQKNPDDYPFPVFHSQGGGLVKEVGRSPFTYVFVEAPDGCPGLKVGDQMPTGWDIVPANVAAQRLLIEELVCIDEPNLDGDDY